MRCYNSILCSYELHFPNIVPGAGLPLKHLKLCSITFQKFLYFNITFILTYTMEMLSFILYHNENCIQLNLLVILYSAAWTSS